MRLYDFRAALSLLFFAVALTTPLSDLRAQIAPTDRISIVFSLSLASRQPVSLHLATRYGQLGGGTEWHVNAGSGTVQPLFMHQL